MKPGRGNPASPGAMIRGIFHDCGLLCIAGVIIFAALTPELEAAVLQRPPPGRYGDNDIFRGEKTTPSLREVMHPPHGHHLLLPTSSEQPVKQIPPPPPPPSLENLRPTPSLRTSTYYGGLQDGSSTWDASAEGVLGQPQFRLLWATEGSSSSSASILNDVTRAATPASLTPHTT